MAKNRDLKLVTGVKKVDGEQQLEYKTYPYPIFVKGGVVKEALTLGAELEKPENGLSADLLDELADFVVELYGKQFTRDELIDGIQANDLIQTLMKPLREIVIGKQVENETENFIQEKNR